MIIAVQTTRGPSRIYIEVATDNEEEARRAAYKFTYGEEEPTNDTLDEYTDVVQIAANITVP